MKPAIGAFAAWANIAASLVAMGVGVAIILRGGSSGADAIDTGANLVWLAEILKLVIALCLVVEVSALARLTGRWLPRLMGSFSAALMFLAGVAGIGALLSPSLRHLGAHINLMAGASLALSSLWALTSVLAGWSRRLFPAWAVAAGILLALPSIAALVFPPAGLVAFVLGIIWHVAVALRLIKSPEV